MKRKVQIAVPKPCRENWDSFTKTSDGGFCASCQKEVIDFTSWSDDRIKLYFKNLKGNACGRFRERQLDPYAFDSANVTAHRWLPVVIAGGLLLFPSRQVLAQQHHDFAHHPIERGIEDEPSKKISETPLTIEVSGVVTSPEDGMPLPGVNVQMKGSQLGTATDKDGKFSLTLNASKTTPVLVFSFIGFSTVEYPLSAVDGQQVIKVEMFLDQQAMNERIVVGQCFAMRWYNPRTWWWKIKSLF